MSLTFSAGQVITADLLNAPLQTTVIKGALTTVTSNVTLANDSELFVDLATGRTYEITAVILAGGPAAADVKIAWTNTGTMVQLGARVSLAPGLGVVAVTGAATVRIDGGNLLTTAVPYGTDGVGIGHIQEKFIVSVTSAGRLTLQWAQNTSTASATTIYHTSFITAKPIA